jgi:hypothetical protein
MGSFDAEFRRQEPREKLLFMYRGAADPRRDYAIHQTIEGSVSQGHVDRHCDLSCARV